MRGAGPWVPSPSDSDGAGWGALREPGIDDDIRKPKPLEQLPLGVWGQTWWQHDLCDAHARHRERRHEVKYWVADGKARPVACPEPPFSQLQGC